METTTLAVLSLINLTTTGMSNDTVETGNDAILFDDSNIHNMQPAGSDDGSPELLVEDFSEDEEGGEIISDELRKILEIVFFVVMSGGIGTVGCVTNVINMMVFWRQGFKDSVNISLFGLAIADFGSVFTLVWMAVCFTPQFRFSGIPFESTDVQYPTAGWPHMFFARSTSLITAFIAFERCLCIALPLKVKTILTARRTFIVVLTIFIINLLSVVPMYYAISLAPVYLPARNQTLIAIVFRPGGLKVESVCFALTELYQLSSFVLVIIFTAVLIRNLMKKSKWRQQATGGGSTAPRSTQSTTAPAPGSRPGIATKTEKATNSGKDRRVMVLVLGIACIFIACFLPSATNLVVIILLPDYNITGSYKNTFQVTGGLCNACESINSSVNILLYYNMSSKYRAVFRKMVGAKDDGSDPSMASENTANSQM